MDIPEVPASGYSRAPVSSGSFTVSDVDARWTHRVLWFTRRGFADHVAAIARALGIGGS